MFNNRIRVSLWNKKALLDLCDPQWDKLVMNGSEKINNEFIRFSILFLREFLPVSLSLKLLKTLLLASNAFSDIMSIGSGILSMISDPSIKILCTELGIWIFSNENFSGTHCVFQEAFFVYGISGHYTT